jgi:sec-independent protein translocase protein TatB
MLNVGMTELLAFGIIALLVLGPEKLPEAARFAGKWYAKIKRMISSVQTDIDRELRMSELREQMQQEMQRIQELEQKMQLQMQAMQQQKLNTEPTVEKLSTSLSKTATSTYYTPILVTHSPVILQNTKQQKDILKHQLASSVLPELKVAV